MLSARGVALEKAGKSDQVLLAASARSSASCSASHLFEERPVSATLLPNATRNSGIPKITPQLSPKRSWPIRALPFTCRVKAGWGFLSTSFTPPWEAQRAHLMGAAGGGAAGNVDHRQRTVRQIRLSGSLHAGVVQRLGIPHALLADRSTDAGHRMLKAGACAVLGGSQHLFRFGGGAVDHIHGTVRAQAHLHLLHGLNGIQQRP